MEKLLHRPELRLPADERCLQARRPPLTAECRHDAGGAPQPNGFGLPLELVLARVVIGDRRLAQPPRRLADEDGSGRGRGLDARRRVDEVAGDHALALGTDGDRRLAGDDTGPQAEIGKAGLGAEGVDLADQVERRTDGPLGVVLLCDRRTPDRHDRITDELLDRPAVAPDDAPGRIEVAGEQISHLLGIATLRERREADEIREQDGDDPPLGFRRRGGRPSWG